MGRKLKHKDQLAEARTRGLDRCHKNMKKLGFARFLFFGFCGMDRMNPSHKLMRIAEFKTFVLIEPSLNSVDQMKSFRETKVIM